MGERRLYRCHDVCEMERHNMIPKAKLRRLWSFPPIRTFLGAISYGLLRMAQQKRTIKLRIVLASRMAQSFTSGGSYPVHSTLVPASRVKLHGDTHPAGVYGTTQFVFQQVDDQAQIFVIR